MPMVEINLSILKDCNESYASKIIQKGLHMRAQNGAGHARKPLAGLYQRCTTQSLKLRKSLKQLMHNRITRHLEDGKIISSRHV